MTAVADLFDLTGKVAVITGGAGGIGVVYAEALAEAGAAVVVADLDLAAATATAEALTAKGHTVIGASVDVRSAESAEAMAAPRSTPSAASTSWSTTRRSWSTSRPTGWPTCPLKSGTESST